LKTTANAFGNNDGTVTIGGENADGDVQVGTNGGTLTVLTGYLDVDAAFGSAQLGYHGAGGKAIDVTAVDDVSVTAEADGLTALIGNGGTDVTGDVGGDITISAGNVFVYGGGIENVDEFTAGPSTIAAIGNISGGATASQSGDISITTTSGLTLTTAGVQSTAQIGNFSAVATSGGATGTIDIESSGSVDIYADGASSRAIIGQGGTFTESGATGGNVTVIAHDIFMEAADGGHGSQARIANRGFGAVSGDYDIETTSGDISMWSYGTNLVAIGNGEGGSGTTSGSITVYAADMVQLEGLDSGQVRIANGAAPNSDITVTGVNGVVLRTESYTDGSGGMAFIGNFSNDTVAVGGTVSVNAPNGCVELDALEDSALTLIGNQAGTTTSGNVSVTAGDGGIVLDAESADSTAQIGNQSDTGAVSGDVLVQTSGSLGLFTDNGGTPWIGNRAADGFVESGDLTVVAVDLDKNDSADLGGMIVAALGTSATPGSGGNVTIGFTHATDHDQDAIFIDRGIAYDSPNAFSILSGDSFVLTDVLQNAG